MVPLNPPACVYSPHLLPPEKVQVDKVRYGRTLPTSLEAPLRHIPFLTQLPNMPLDKV